MVFVDHEYNFKNSLAWFLGWQHCGRWKKNEGKILQKIVMILTKDHLRV